MSLALRVCVNTCVWVPVYSMKSVSQREKINDSSVTGTSPSTLAHMHMLIPPTDMSLHHIHTQYAHFLTHCSASLLSLSLHTV